MKKILAILVVTLALASCKKDPVVTPGVPDAPQGYVPGAAVGQWLYGTFSMNEFWGYDGSYQGNAFELSVAFNFMADGTYEEFFVASTNDYGCRSDAFSYYKGVVVFEGDSAFTVYPQQGNFRGWYNCTPSWNFDRTATADELDIQKFYYTIETDEYGKTYMVVRFVPSDEYPSYFAPTSW